MSKLARTSVNNIDMGSRACPIIGQCRDFGVGVGHGDFKKVGESACLLTLGAAVAHSAAGTKVAVRTISSGAMIGGATGL